VCVVVTCSFQARLGSSCSLPSELFSHLCCSLLSLSLAASDRFQDDYSIAYIEKKKTILFPVQTEYAMQVDQDLKEMWNAVPMPKSAVELEEKLHAHGHLSESQYRVGHLQKSRLLQAQIKLAQDQRNAADTERRAKRRRYPQKLTNTHLLGQYEWSVAGTLMEAPIAWCRFR
jgi:hypothetical protein